MADRASARSSSQISARSSPKRGSAGGARAGEVDRELRLDPSRPVGHHHDAVAEQDRLVDRVRDEQHGLPVGPATAPRAPPATAHASARPARPAARPSAARAGFTANARARDKRWRMPPEKLVRVGRFEAREPDPAEPAPRHRGALPRAHAAHPQPEGCVVEHAEPGKQPVLLKHERDLRARPDGHPARGRRSPARRRSAAAWTCHSRRARTGRRTRRRRHQMLIPASASTGPLSPRYSFRDVACAEPGRCTIVASGQRLPEPFDYLRNDRVLDVRAPGRPGTTGSSRSGATPPLKAR